MEERKFYYTKGNYLIKLKPETEKYFRPKTILQFAIVLPFFIPFKENSNIFIPINQGKDEGLANIHFTSVNYKELLYFGAYNEEATEDDQYRTRVEMTFVYNKRLNIDRMSEEQRTEELTHRFEMLLEKLNDFIDSYRIKKKDLYVHNITKEMLDPLILYRFCDGNNFNLLSEGLFHLHFNKFEQHKNYLNKEETKDIVNFIDKVERGFNPFFYSINLKFDAQREFKYGYFKHSILSIQTSLESLFSNLFQEFLIEEGLSNEIAAIKAREIRFKSLITDQFEKRIGGNFSIEGDGVISVWWENTYILRNSIVHEGYQPNFTETKLGIDSALDVFPFVVQLLKEKKNVEKYPRINEYFSD